MSLYEFAKGKRTRILSAKCQCWTCHEVSDMAHKYIDG